MTITVTCGCGKRLKLPMTHVGKPAACPACHHSLRIVAHGPVRDPRAPGGRFVIRSGPQHVGEQVFPLGESPIEVGKLASADLRLVGDLVSRRHCRLVPMLFGWRIEDVNSTNGLFVNDERVASHALCVGDRVRVGVYELTYDDAPSAAAEPAAEELTGLAVVGPPTGGRTERAEVEQNDEEGLYRIAAAPDEMVGQGAGADTPATSAGAPSETVGPVCPCCGQQMAPSAKICVECGVDVRTGRSILTAEETRLDHVYSTAERLARSLSWVFWFGLYPIASEAFGPRKPHATRAIALITIITSVWFLAYEWTASPHMRNLKNLMLWAGDGDPSEEELYTFYELTEFGDSEAFFDKYMELERANPELSNVEVLRAAHSALPREQQYQGEYRSSQLITHAFLHGGLAHLAGNLVFLLVFGSRVNAMIGSLPTSILYPILAVGAAAAHVASMTGKAPAPMLGASGAIMGLAGMYLVLFPLHKVHMIIWFRWVMMFGVPLSFKIWSMRGFWVVLFYIAFDVFYTAIGVDDGTAHWAHLGGFGVGVAAGLVMLCARLINARGADLLSAILGRHAWALVGRPNRGPGFLQRLP